MTARLLLGTLSLAAATIVAPAPAFACRGPQWETATLLPTLPALAHLEEVVAKVEIVEPLKPPWLSEWKFTPLARARVVEGIKGIEAGQVIVVDSRGTSCDQVFSQDAIGTQGYVAGRLERNPAGETVFAGQWQIDLTTGVLRKVR